jgi:hypothetical protein
MTGRVIIIAITVLLSAFCVWNTPLLFLKEMIFIRAGVKEDTTRTRFSGKISVLTIYSFVGVSIMTFVMQFVICTWALTSGIGVKLVALAICIILVLRALLVLLNIGFRISISRGGLTIYFSAYLEETVTFGERVGRALEAITTLYLFYLLIVLLQMR